MPQMIKKTEFTKSCKCCDEYFKTPCKYGRICYDCQVKNLNAMIKRRKAKGWIKT